MHAAPRRPTPDPSGGRPRRTTRRHRLTALACGLLAAAGSAALATPAHAYDITEFEAGTLTDADDDATYFQQAGGRPTFGVTDFTFATDGAGEPVGNTRTIRVDIPAGLTPDPLAIPTCTNAQLAAEACPVESQIGVQRLTIRGTIVPLGRQTVDVRIPLFNMVRLDGQVARFAFNPAQAPGSDLLLGDKGPIQIVGGVRSDDNGLFFTISNLPADPALVRSKLVFWGVPGDPSHDAERTQARTDIPAIPASTPILGPVAHQTSGGGASVAARDVAFLSMPTSCAGQQTSHLETTSAAGDRRTASYTTPVGVEGCGAVPFAPGTSIGPAQVTRDSPALGLHDVDRGGQERDHPDDPRPLRGQAGRERPLRRPPREAGPDAGPADHHRVRQEPRAARPQRPPHGPDGARPRHHGAGREGPGPRRAPLRQDHPPRLGRPEGRPLDGTRGAEGPLRDAEAGHARRERPRLGRLRRADGAVAGGEAALSRASPAATVRP